MGEVLAKDAIPNLWNEAEAPGDAVDGLIYRSRLLGSDLRVTNFAGGNTSCKRPSQDAVDEHVYEQLWVKGSGGDLGTLQPSGLAVLDNGRVVGLERTFRGADFEDEQVALLVDCLVEPRGAAPSIDTPLHALVPHRHVDHVHPDALISFATAAGGRDLVEELFAGEIGWLEWQRPGYDLALKLKALTNSHPTMKGVVLGGHGLITWADDARECYTLTIDVINRAATAIRQRGDAAPFGRTIVGAGDQQSRRRQAARIFPMLRGLAGDLAAGGSRKVGHFRDDEAVLEFIGSEKAARLVAAGTSCPDHFLRTKRRPLMLDLPPDGDPIQQREVMAGAFAAYREDYASYYAREADEDSPAPRDPSPVIVLWPGIGMFSFSASKPEARIAGEFYLNAINVMRGAETLDSYQGLSESEAFRIEYWALEEAKLKRMPPERPLSRRVALVTGGAGGIGQAIAHRLIAEGAAVVVADLDIEGATSVAEGIGEQAFATRLDVTDEASVDAALEAAALQFGGVDLLVNNAGISLSRTLGETTLAEYEKVHAVIDRGSFLMSRAFARMVDVQSGGGDIVYILSKNAVFAGPSNVAYSSAKAAQLHQMHLLATELADLGIRVNGVSPDAVIQGSKIFAGDWGRDRAEKYGVAREELGQYYAQRSLLKREILPEDIASACFALVGGLLPKTTGMVIPVDGGVPAAFLR
jgi:rhamnulose-1-phosphate aldolase/alcohol dehydrogenase